MDDGVTASLTLRAALARGPAAASFACNDTRAIKRVDTLARALSRDLILANSSRAGYAVHGQFGIFARGDRIPGTNRHLHVNYAGVKARFMFARTCAEHERLRRSSGRHMSICEVGFNAGLSSLLFLEAAPTATVHSFDLGDLSWSRLASRLLKENYGTRRFPGVVFGDSARTLRARHRAQPLRCDVAFIDGDKSFAGRLQSLHDMRDISRPGALIFLDDLTSRACIDGSVPEADFLTRCVGGGSSRTSRQHLHTYATTVRAYDHASRAGLLRVGECVWPPGYKHKDGVCTAELRPPLKVEQTEPDARTVAARRD